MSLEKSCIGCIKMDTCKFFDTAQNIKKEFDGRFQEDVLLPLIPEQLAEKCNHYVSLVAKEKPQVQAAVNFLFAELQQAKENGHELRVVEIHGIINNLYKTGEITLES